MNESTLWLNRFFSLDLSLIVNYYYYYIYYIEHKTKDDFPYFEIEWLQENISLIFFISYCKSPSTNYVCDFLIFSSLTKIFFNPLCLFRVNLTCRPPQLNGQKKKIRGKVGIILFSNILFLHCVSNKKKVNF